MQNAVTSIAIFRHNVTTEGTIDLVRQAKADVVFHLAWQFISEHSHADLAPLICSNILFANRLVEAMVANHSIYLINT